jgi:hypothetical protein
MKELIYDISIASIALMLFVLVMLAVYGSYWLGIKKHLLNSEPMKSQVTNIQGALLGLLALLLGFTFSIASHHFDERSEAMKEEANAIGTTYLRAQALPESVRQETLDTLKSYVETRIQESGISLDKEAEIQPLLQEAGKLRAKLWRLAMQAVKDDDRVTTTGLYIQTLNSLIDTYGTRDEALNRHIPEEVNILLGIAIVLSGLSIGYTSALYNHRPSVAALVFMAAVIILTCMIMDMDRPRRGFILVSQKNMLDLREDINLQ